MLSDFFYTSLFFLLTYLHFWKKVVKHAYLAYPAGLNPVLMRVSVR